MTGVWLLAIAVAIVAGFVSAFGSFDGLEWFFISLFVAAFWVWPLHWIFSNIDEEQDRRSVERAAIVNGWVDTMTKAGCKRTSYVATRSRTTPVWTCPDGTAHLQDQ